LVGCKQAYTKPKFEELDDAVDPWAFAVSMNIQRRHLTGDQRKIIIGRAAKAMGEVRPEGGTGANQHRKASSVSNGNAAPSLAERAAKLGVSKGTVSKAIKAVDDFDALPPKLKEEVRGGGSPH
jgi:hypothetical protein